MGLTKGCFRRGDLAFRYVKTRRGYVEPQALVIEGVRRWSRWSIVARTTTGASLSLDADQVYPSSGSMSESNHPLAWGAAIDHVPPRRRNRRRAICASCGEQATADERLGFVHADGSLVAEDGHWIAPKLGLASAEVAVPVRPDTGPLRVGYPTSTGTRRPA